MANQEKRGLFSHYLLLAGEAIQFRPLRSFSSSLHKDEKKRIWSDRLIPYKLKIKTALARAAEQSLALTGIKRAQRDFFTARVRSFGVLFFSCGFFQILSYFLKDTLPLLSGGADNLILGVAMIFLTLLCSFSRGDVNYALERSFLFRAILRPIFGVGEWEIPKGQSNENLTVMFLSGIVMALIAVAVSPSFLVVLLGSLVLTLFVFARPEAGLICSAVFLPVLLPVAHIHMDNDSCDKSLLHLRCHMGS